MTAAHSVRGLLICELDLIYNGLQQLKAARVRAKCVTGFSPLTHYLSREEKQAEKNLDRIERCFVLLKEPCGNAVNNTVRGFLKDFCRVIDEPGVDAVRAAKMVGELKKHVAYQIAVYTVARAWAETIGEEGVVGLLQDNLGQQEENRISLQSLSAESNSEAYEQAEAHAGGSEDLTHPIR
jgi:ferritin-like metal-binding protein YciE